MNRFSWWCKHFHLVYLFISIILHGSFASYSSSSSLEWTGDEPTEEPEEFVSTSTRVVRSTETVTLLLANASTEIYSDDDITTTRTNNNISTEQEAVKTNESFSTERHDQDRARAFPHSSGNGMWKTAGRFLHKGLRMFRESILEGAKVAHMFKEDVGEGVQNIMRQNRGMGMKKMDGTSENSKFDPGYYPGPGSFFDSQLLREGVIGGILRFMGIDSQNSSKRLGVLALNVLIILAEWITSSMIGSNQVAGVTGRMMKTNLLQWANTGHNAQIENLLTQVKSHALPEKLIAKLSEKTGNSTSCVQLLVCKMSPVIWGFQDTVNDQMKAFGIKEETPWRTAPPTTTSSYNRDNETLNDHEDNEEDESRGFLAGTQYLIDKFLDRLPPMEKMVVFGDRCEAKFPNCKLLKFGLK